MNYITRLGAAALVIGSLSGCGNSDFNGTYGTDGPFGKNVILSISGDDAKIFLSNKASGEIGDITDFSATYKNEKILLDSADGNTRLVFQRDVDERGLDCINCKSFRMSNKWILADSKPFDVDSMLKEQEKKKQAAKEQAEKLAKFDGDWVLKRDSKQVALIIFSISSQKGAKWRAFNYSSAAKMIDVDRLVKANGNELSIISQNDSTNYALSDDGKQLRCIDCKKESYFVKADPIKISDLNYTRALAGDPQE